MTANGPLAPALAGGCARAALVALWALYFWRLFTPSDADVLSLREGDFSGQFVAFFSYQVERLGDGEVPLWNPYNYAGHPFLADTQSAVFYPPRLLTVALVNALDRTAPGDLYTALQAEMALHVLLASLLMYAFARRLTAASGAHRLASITGGLVAALTYAYGGYLAGYPPLQLAVLEAGVWLPLALLAIFEATRAARPGWLCLMLAGTALGLALLAGHPQTALFALYLSLAWLGYRLWQAGATAWRPWLARFVMSAAVLGLVAGGLAAVQLLPGLEYLRHTSRDTLAYAEKAHGFPLRDLVQVVFPGIMSEWSPLYVGIARAGAGAGRGVAARGAQPGLRNRGAGGAGVEPGRGNRPLRRDLPDRAGRELVSRAGARRLPRRAMRRDPGRAGRGESAGASGGRERGAAAGTGVMAGGRVARAGGGRVVGVMAWHRHAAL